MLGTTYTQDLVPVSVNGVISNQTPARLATTFGAGNIRTPTAHFSFVHNKHIINCTKNVPFVVDAVMLATLTAIGAPVV